MRGTVPAAAAQAMLLVAVIGAGAVRSQAAEGQVGEKARSAADISLAIVELADETRELHRGLMFRRSLCDECGMLFVLPEERIVSLWMKGTLLSLDMIFMNSEGRIVTIHRATRPMQEDPNYTASEPARYILEVNAGFADRHGLETGQTVDMSSLMERSVDFRWVDREGAPLLKGGTAD